MSDLKEFIDAAQLRKDVSINPEALDNDMMTHASLYTHYATQAIYARRQYERIKAAFEILEASLDDEYRRVLKEENPKTTEAQIRAAVVKDKRWSGAQGKLIDAQQIYKLADVAVESFSQRKDMILEVARDRRKEREGQLRVLEAKDAETSRTSSLDRAKQAAKAAAQSITDIPF